MIKSKDTPLDFTGQTIYVGLDVHLKNSQLAIYVEDLFYKNLPLPSKASLIGGYLKKEFPNAHYKSVYEAGFSGFRMHKDLVAMGIENIVVHPADVPMGHKQKEQKTDKRDAKQLALSLKAGFLTPLYIPSEKQLADRSLLRYRDKMVGDRKRTRQRVKSFLYSTGIPIPDEFEQSLWTRKYMNWLSSIKFDELSSRNAMDHMLTKLASDRLEILKMNRTLRALCKTDYYKTDFELLLSIPGVGLFTAMRVLMEIGSMSRFETTDQLCSYAGLIPNSNSSGEKERKSRITHRKNKQLRTQLIEASWVAIRNDPALTLFFHKKLKQKGGDTKAAIVCVARKLLCRIRAVLVYQTPYQKSKAK